MNKVKVLTGSSSQVSHLEDECCRPLQVGLSQAGVQGDHGCLDQVSS
jgi:hypothetical protein